MNKIQDLAKKVNKLSKEIEELKKKEDILVPENIHIEEGFGVGDGLGISSNDDKQVLYYFGGIWSVGRGVPEDKVQCKLIKCDRSDLKSGDTAYRSENGLDHIKSLDRYCKILEDNDYVYINTRQIGVGRGKRKDRYKVVEA